MKPQTLLLILLLLSFSCRPNTGPDYPITNKDYQKGVDGVDVKFLPSGPPDKVFELTGFDIAAEVRNKGAYDVYEGYITANLENAYMCIVPKDTKCSDQNSPMKSPCQEQLSQTLTEPIAQQSKVLKGRQIGFPDGGYLLSNFKACAQPLDLLAEQHTSPVILTACYNYMTVYAQDVCIDPDTQQTAQVTKACQMKDITLTDQGAPIAITKIEVRTLPQNDYSAPQFIIYIANKGKGQVIDPTKIKDACSAAKLSGPDWNSVRISDFRFSNQNYRYVFGNPAASNIECTPNPRRLTSTDNTDAIRCTVQVEKLSEEQKIRVTDAAFTSQMYIRLDYGYVQSFTKDVVVEKVRR